MGLVSDYLERKLKLDDPYRLQRIRDLVSGRRFERINHLNVLDLRYAKTDVEAELVDYVTAFYHRATELREIPPYWTIAFTPRGNLVVAYRNRMMKIDQRKLFETKELTWPKTGEFVWAEERLNAIAFDQVALEMHYPVADEF